MVMDEPSLASSMSFCRDTSNLERETEFCTIQVGANPSQASIKAIIIQVILCACAAY